MTNDHFQLVFAFEPVSGTNKISAVISVMREIAKQQGLRLNRTREWNIVRRIMNRSAIDN